MAMFSVKMVFVLLLSTLQFSSGYALELTDACPAVHTIRKPDGVDLRIDLYIKQVSECAYNPDDMPCEDCSRVDKVRNRRARNGYNANEDLPSPKMTPVAVNGEYYLKIDLEIAPGADGAYPKKLYLEWVSYNRTDYDKKLDQKCLLFKISNTTANHYWPDLHLPLTCLKLIDDTSSQIMLSSQVWTFPGRRSSSVQPCRQTRALVGSKICGVHCSQESMYPLSLAGENEYELCTCADRSLFKSEIGYLDKRLIIRLEGLPPMIGPIAVKVFNRSQDVYEGSIDTSNFKDGRGEFNITKNLVPDNYTVLFDGKCQFSREVSLNEMDRKMEAINMACGNSFGDSNIHAVAYFDIFAKETSVNSVVVIFGVLTAVAMVGLVTSIIFFIQHRKSQSGNSDSLNNNGNIEMQHTVTDSAVVSPLLDTRTHTQMETYFDDKPEKVEDTNTVHSSNLNLQTMMMYHPDTETHVTNVEILTKQIRDKGVEMVCTNFENWQTYAEGAVDCHPNIVIFLSARLVELCACYKTKENPAMESEEFKKLIKERCGEYIPCIVMDKVRVKILENPQRTDFLLHLIIICDSVENGEKLKACFYREYEVLNRTNNVHCYYFTHEEAAGNTHKLDALVSNISSLS